MYLKKFRSNSLFPFGGMSSPLDATSPTSPSSSRFTSFFRRRRKSTNLSTEDEDISSGTEAAGRGEIALDGSSENVDGGGGGGDSSKAYKKEVYGNYNTVSGTGANLLRDIFNSKYRSSIKSNSLASKLRSKKGTIKEENGKSLNSRNSSQLQADVRRSRHTSISYESTPRKHPTNSKLGGFMPSFKGIFDSFRQRSHRDSTPDTNQLTAPSLSPIQPTPNSTHLATTIVYAPGKKKKKFKVSAYFEINS